MNRERFDLHDLYRKFLDRVVAEGIEHKLVSPDRFTIDGTLIHSLASHKSLRPIDPGTRSSTKKMSTMRAAPPAGIRRWIGVARGDPTPRTARPPTPKHAWPARATARSLTCATADS